MSDADTLWYHILISLAGREFGIHGFVSQFGLSNQVGQRQISVGTCHQVGKMIIKQIALSSLSHTTKYTKNHFGSFGIALQSAATLSIQCFQTVINLLLGVISNRAGVQEYSIGLVDGLGGFVTSHLHHRCNNFRIGHIHLAAIRFNI